MSAADYEKGGNPDEQGLGQSALVGREIMTFLGFLLALSAIALTLVAASSEPGQGLVALLMWSPGLSALLTLVLWRRSVRGLGWGLGRPVFLGYGYFAPILYASFVYATLWLTGVTSVDVDVAQRISVSALLMFIPGTLVASVTALGEELGWRGFLVPRLVPRFGLVGTSLITGGLWAAWHYPLLWIAPEVPSTPRYFQAMCFTVMAVGLSFLMTFLRVAGQSVWPAVLLHASHNVWIQGFFDRLTAHSTNAEWWSGESGIGLALACIVIGWLTIVVTRGRAVCRAR